MEFPTRIEENPKMALLILPVLVIFGMGISAIIFALIANLIPSFKEILYNAAPQTADYMRAMIFVNFPITFLLPALYISWRYHPDRPARFTKINKAIPLKFVFIAILAFLVSQPGLNLIGDWNKGINLPDSLNRLMQWITQKEAEAEAMSKMMIETHSTGIMLLNVLVIAILPGFCEEVLFRGVVQPIFADWLKSKHAAVWVTAFVFSFIHFQFLGFVPRLLLGAMLGYLVMYSGSLWTSILAHSLNNAFIVVLSYLQFNKISCLDIDSLGYHNTIWLGTLSIAITLYFFSLAAHYKIEKIEIETEE
ncbi:MAG: CPBP family intramembrane metalloprotease [Bacteroidales bacterium]|nr:CPBP family intramembrane metalloprotease [Bacteroidales bacterium]